MSLSSNIRAGAAYVEVTAETSKLQRNLKTAQAELQNFGRTCTNIGKDLLMLSGALALPLGLAVKGFAEFDDQMRLARAVTKATAAEFDSMTKVAQKLGRETSFTAKQVADGMVALGRMGFSPKEIEAAIQPTLDLARATGTELGEAADIAANSMRIFGIEAGKMSSVADILTATANGSAQTLTDLFEALKMAGPQAKAAGENITDTAGAIGVLANFGIKGSLAGTALRKSFSQFAKIKVQDQLKAVGVETVQANGDLRKMADIMADVGKVMNAMPTADRIAFAEDIFDIRGSLAGLSLGGNVKDLESFIARLQDVDGTARQTAQEMDAGLGGSFRMLMSAVEGAMNAVAKALEGTLQSLVDKLTAVTLAVISWIEANSGMVTGFAVAVAGAAALGVVLITIGVAAKAAAGIAVVQTTLKAFTFLQGLCIAQGTTLGTSLSLIDQAFVNYRNLAIPALVGTEQLCAAAAFCAILISWVLIGVGAALAGVVIWLSQAGSYTAKLSDKMSELRVTNAEDLAKLRELKDLSLKVNLETDDQTKAAGLIAELSGKYGNLGLTVDQVAGRIAVLANRQKDFAAATQMIQAGDDPLKETHLAQLERLQKLAEQEKLTGEEQAEAQNIVNALNGAYGGLGLGIDTITGKLNLASDAQQKLNDKMKQATLAELDGEIAEMEANLKELQAEDEALLSYWNHNLWSQISGRQEEAVKKLEANGDRALAYRQKINAARKRKEAINEGDETAITGEDGATTQEKVDAENQRRAAGAQEAAEAAGKVAEIDKKLARERQTALENEIEDIGALRDEYKALIQTMLDYEKSKPDGEQDKGKIAELEGKLAQADKTAEDRIAKAQEKAAEKLKKDAADLQRRFTDNEKDIQQRREEQAQDRAVDDTLKSDKNAGVSMLQGMIEEYRQAAQFAKEQFQKELEAAQGDGTIDDNERDRLNELQSNYSRAESMLDKYEGKLRDAQEGTQLAAEKSEKPQGAFLAAALEALGGGGTAADRTAKATEAIASNTRKANEFLRKGSTTTFG